MDSYGLSKVVNEQTARSFQRRSDFDIYALRIGSVIERDEYAKLFPYYLTHPEVRRRNALCYIDVRDLSQIVNLCLQKDGLGYQVYNSCNDQNGAILQSKELVERFFPGVPLRRELNEHEAIAKSGRFSASRNNTTGRGMYHKGQIVLFRVHLANKANQSLYLLNQVHQTAVRHHSGEIRKESTPVHRYVLVYSVTSLFK